MATSYACQESQHGLLGSAKAPLALRVEYGEHAGKVLHLHSAKCTIGSDPRATLRLVAAGIRPIHCLILRGEQGTYIRRWTRDTLVNGAAFETRRLCDGDRLDIGHIQMSVLDAQYSEIETNRQSMRQDESPAAEEERAADPRLAQQQATIDRLNDELSSLQDQLREAESWRIELNRAIAAADEQADQWRRKCAAEQECRQERAKQADESSLQYECRLEQLNDELATAQLRLSDWQREAIRQEPKTTVSEPQDDPANDGADAGQSRVAAELSEKLTATETRVQTLEQQLADSQQQIERAEKTADDAKAEVNRWREATERLNQELAANRTTHQQARDEWHTDRENLQRELANRSESLQQQKMQHDELMSEAERLIHSLQREGKQLLTQLSEAKQMIRQIIEERKALEATVKWQESTGVSRRESPTVAIHPPADSGMSPGELMPSATPQKNQVGGNFPLSAAAAEGSATHSRGEMAVDEQIYQCDPHGMDASVTGDAGRTSVTSSATQNVATGTPADSSGSDEAMDPDDEGYIHAYVQRLLGRSDTTSQDAGTADAPDRPRGQPSGSAQPQDVPDRPSSAVQQDPADSQPDTPKATKKRRDATLEAPEKLSIGVLREVANSSARLAIGVSQHRQRKSSATTCLIVAAICGICGTAIMVLSDDLSSPLAIGGLTGVGFALNRVWRAAGLLRQLRWRDGQPHEG